MHLFSYGKSTIFLVFFYFVVVLSVPLFAAGTETDTAQQTAVSAGDESSIVLDANAALPAAKQAKGPSSVWVLLRVVVVLAIVCAAIYGVVWLLKKTTVVNAANDPYLKAVSSITLAPNKTVQVVTIGGKAYLLGVSEQNVSLIDEITDRELIDAMNLEAYRKASVPPASFASVIGSFLPGLKEKGHARETAVDAADSRDFGAADVIRMQRDRLSASRAGDVGSSGDVRENEGRDNDGGRA